MINMISVVIPVMNESENIAQLVPRIYLLPYDVEVLLVDVKDGSSDGTGEVVAELKNNYKNLNLIRQSGKGFANALIEGLKAANCEFIVTMDAENHIPEEIPVLLQKLQDENADVVIGSRFLKDSDVDLDRKRFLPSQIGNMIASASLKLKIKDCSSGFRAYKASTVQNAIENMKTQYFSVQVEILDRVKEAGGKLLEIPCTYLARESGESKYKIEPAFMDGMHILKIATDHRVEDMKSTIEDMKEKAGSMGKETTGNMKEKFRDMKIGADQVKAKGKEMFRGTFKNKFKNKFN